MDCRSLNMDAPTLDKFMLTRARLWLDKGQKFGFEGHGYMRVNLRCPRSTVEEAIRRLTTALTAVDTTTQSPPAHPPTPQSDPDGSRRGLTDTHVANPGNGDTRPDSARSSNSSPTS